MFLVGIRHTLPALRSHPPFTKMLHGGGVLQVFHRGRVAKSGRCPTFGRASEGDDSAILTETSDAGPLRKGSTVTFERGQALGYSAGRGLPAYGHPAMAPA